MELLNKLSGSHSCTVLFNTTQSINALKINHPKTGVLDLTTQLCKVLESYFPSSTEINLLVREFFSSNYVPYEPSVLTYILKFSFSHSPFFGGGGGGRRGNVLNKPLSNTDLLREELLFWIHDEQGSVLGHVQTVQVLPHHFDVETLADTGE